MEDGQDKKKKEVSTLANHWQRWSDRDLTTAIWLVQADMTEEQISVYFDRSLLSARILRYKVRTLLDKGNDPHDLPRFLEAMHRSLAEIQKE